MRSKCGCWSLMLMIFLGMACAATADVDLMRRRQYVSQHPELSQKVKQAILRGEIFLGMTREQVEASWGKPHSINRSIGIWGTHEQWVYGYKKYYGAGVSGFVPTHYLYFENGILTSWQEVGK